MPEMVASFNAVAPSIGICSRFFSALPPAARKASKSTFEGLSKTSHSTPARRNAAAATGSFQSNRRRMAPGLPSTAVALTAACEACVCGATAVPATVPATGPASAASAASLVAPPLGVVETPPAGRRGTKGVGLAAVAAELSAGAFASAGASAPGPTGSAGGVSVPGTGAFSILTSGRGAGRAAAVTGPCAPLRGAVTSMTTLGPLRKSRTRAVSGTVKVTRVPSADGANARSRTNFGLCERNWLSSNRAGRSMSTTARAPSREMR